MEDCYEKCFGKNYDIDIEGRLTNIKTKKSIKFRKDKDGYLVCNIRINGKRVTRFQHRMMAVKYLPNPE